MEYEIIDLNKMKMKS